MQETGALKVSTPSDIEVVVTRAFAAPRNLVFRAFTECQYLKRWMTGPGDWELAVCEIDLRVGGRYRYVMRGPEGEEMGWGGAYREIAAPERVVNTELFDEDWTGGETLVTNTFDEQSGRTTLTMTVLYASKEARDGAIATGMTEGMEMGFKLLDELLTSMQG